MPVVYVAGPFRAPTPWLIEQNVRTAEAASLEIWKLGAAALCPHTNTRFFQHSAPDEVWIEGTLELLRRCDALVLVGDRWRESTGTVKELELAHRLGLPVFVFAEGTAGERERLSQWIADKRKKPVAQHWQSCFDARTRRCVCPLGILSVGEQFRSSKIDD